MQGLAKDFIANEVVNWNNRGNEKKGKVRGCFFLFTLNFFCMHLQYIMIFFVFVFLQLKLESQLIYILINVSTRMTSETLILI